MKLGRRIPILAAMTHSQCCSTGSHFDDAVARRDLRRYRRRGPDKPTGKLLAAVQSLSLPGNPTLLDIGGGVGTIHHRLLDQGFSRATQIDASESYLAQSENEARRIGHADRVRFLQAYFPLETPDVPPADLVTLHRVVCCDPDYGRLLGSAALHARRFLAFSYPRERRLIRWMVAASNTLYRLRRREFRVFVHSPARMKATLEEAGMRRIFSGGTWSWAVDVFRRDETEVH